MFSIIVNGSRGDSAGVDDAIDAFVERLGKSPPDPVGDFPAP